MIRAQRHIARLLLICYVVSTLIVITLFIYQYLLHHILIYLPIVILVYVLHGKFAFFSLIGVIACVS